MTPRFCIMSRPHREHRSEIFTDAVRNASVAKPIDTYWFNSYKDCVKLGEELILNHIRMNPRLRNNIYNRKRFVENKEDGIYFNLIEFSEAYRAKFINSDFDEYCLKFMELFKPLLGDFVSKMGYGAHAFKFVFRLDGRVFEKSITVFAVHPLR